MGTTGDDTIGLFARCFIAAVLAFLLFSPLYRSWGSCSSWWDAAAGRKVAKILKLLVFVEIIRDVWLLYQVIELGNPVQGVDRDIHFYWTYGMYACTQPPRPQLTLPLSPLQDISARCWASSPSGWEWSQRCIQPSASRASRGR